MLILTATIAAVLGTWLKDRMNADADVSTIRGTQERPYCAFARLDATVRQKITRLYPEFGADPDDLLRICKAHSHMLFAAATRETTEALSSYVHRMTGSMTEQDKHSIQAFAMLLPEQLDIAPVVYKESMSNMFKDKRQAFIDRETVIEAAQTLCKNRMFKAYDMCSCADGCKTVGAVQNTTIRRIKALLGLGEQAIHKSKLCSTALGKKSYYDEKFDEWEEISPQSGGVVPYPAGNSEGTKKWEQDTCMNIVNVGSSYSLIQIIDQSNCCQKGSAKCESGGLTTSSYLVIAFMGGGIMAILLKLAF